MAWPQNDSVKAVEFGKVAKSGYLCGRVANQMFINTMSVNEWASK